MFFNFFRIIKKYLVVGMKTGTGKGSGMGTGTGNGTLYILQGVGIWMGTGIGTMIGWGGVSVWVDLELELGLQLTPYAKQDLRSLELSILRFLMAAFYSAFFLSFIVNLKKINFVKSEFYLIKYEITKNQQFEF